MKRHTLLPFAQKNSQQLFSFGHWLYNTFYYFMVHLTEKLIVLFAPAYFAASSMMAKTASTAVAIALMVIYSSVL